MGFPGNEDDPWQLHEKLAEPPLHPKVEAGLKAAWEAAGGYEFHCTGDFFQLGQNGKPLSPTVNQLHVMNPDILAAILGEVWTENDRERLVNALNSLPLPGEKPPQMSVEQMAALMAEANKEVEDLYRKMHESGAYKEMILSLVGVPPEPKERRRWDYLHDRPGEAAPKPRWYRRLWRRIKRGPKKQNLTMGEFLKKGPK